MKPVEFFKSLPVSVKNDPIKFGNLDGYELAAPESFWNTEIDTRQVVINGCGPGGFGDYLIPDTVYFMSIKSACKIHDWMFLVFNTDEGFELANQIFLDNMRRINNTYTKTKALKFVRDRRIKKYYYAVRDFGRLFFYDNHIHLYDYDKIYVKK